jgi:hypothetical protein
MLSPQIVEWNTFVAENVPTLGSNVAASYADIDQNALTFAIVELEIYNKDRGVSGDMYFGFARITFVASDSYTLDKLLVDVFGDALELKDKQFVTFTCGGVSNVTKTEKYAPENETLIKREVDIQMSWYAQK